MLDEFTNAIINIYFRKPIKKIKIKMVKILIPHWN